MGMETNQTIKMKWNCKIYLTERHVFTVNYKLGKGDLRRQNKQTKKPTTTTTKNPQWSKMKHEDHLTCRRASLFTRQSLKVALD